MKSIVIYYSLLGHNREITEEIAKNSNSEILEFAPGRIWRVFQFFSGGKKLRKKAKQVDISEYDEIIICGPIWAGKPAAAIKNLLEVLDLKGKTVKTYFTFTQDYGETEEAIKSQMKEKGANLTDIQFKNIAKKTNQEA
jgi:flavodoxin